MKNLLAEFGQFIREKGRLILISTLIFCAALLALVFLTQGASDAPFVYTVF